MSRKRKNPNNNIFASWKHDENYKEKANDGTPKSCKRFVGVPHSMLMHTNYIALKPKTKDVYLYMQDYSLGNKVFTFPKSIYSKIVSQKGFGNAVKELIEFGFIKQNTTGKFTRTPNEYEFIDKWKTYENKNIKKKKQFFK